MERFRTHQVYYSEFSYTEYSHQTLKDANAVPKMRGMLTNLPVYYSLNSNKKELRFPVAIKRCYTQTIFLFS